MSMRSGPMVPCSNGVALLGPIRKAVLALLGRTSRPERQPSLPPFAGRLCRSKSVTDSRTPYAPLRIYLVAVSLLLTLFTLFLLWPRTRSFFRMSLITGGVAVLLTFIPGISAHDLGIRSQRARLEKVLPDLLVDGQFPEGAPYTSIAESEDLRQKWDSASSAIDYLQKEMGFDKFKEVYGSYGEFSYYPYEADLLKVDAVDVYDLNSPVPLDGYTVLLPENAYHYYEDSSVVIFYEDDSREKELLRCEVVARLDSSNSEKLVYQNDKYLAVFNSITDFHHADEGPAFTTAGHTLYAKP